MMQYGVKIFVMTSFKDTCYIEIQPKVVKSNKGILIFWFHFQVCVSPGHAQLIQNF
jgi:hypothetical protein